MALLRRLRHHREGVVRTARQRHLVRRQRGQVGGQLRETVDRQPAGVRLTSVVTLVRSDTLAGPTGERRRARVPSRSSSSNRVGAGFTAARSSSQGRGAFSGLSCLVRGQAPSSRNFPQIVNAPGSTFAPRSGAFDHRSVWMQPVWLTAKFSA